MKCVVRDGVAKGPAGEVDRTFQGGTSVIAEEAVGRGECVNRRVNLMRRMDTRVERGPLRPGLER